MTRGGCGKGRKRVANVMLAFLLRLLLLLLLSCFDFFSFLLPSLLLLLLFIGRACLGIYYTALGVLIMPPSSSSLSLTLLSLAPPHELGCPPPLLTTLLPHPLTPGRCLISGSTSASQTTPHSCPHLLHPPSSILANHPHA